ncbi:MAG: hypothetical protein GX766_07375 [Firmicutes bacterium]|nr:hypothetical protein [Bacillota bacterium]HQD39162.1 hypothetical protein [Bacillota bacterium]
MTLVFMRGLDLGLLEVTGRNLRHEKVHSPEQVEEKRSALKELLLAAVELNR